MALDIPRIKDGVIQKILIRKIVMACKELRVYDIDKRLHVAHMGRKNHIPISNTNVKQLLCPVIRFRILTKTHVLQMIVNSHICPKVGVGKSGRNNLFP